MLYKGCIITYKQCAMLRNYSAKCAVVGIYKDTINPEEEIIELEIIKILKKPSYKCRLGPIYRIRRSVIEQSPKVFDIRSANEVERILFF